MSNFSEWKFSFLVDGKVVEIVATSFVVAWDKLVERYPKSIIEEVRSKPVEEQEVE